MGSVTRYVAIGLILAGLLAAMVIGRLLEWLWTYMAWENYALVGRQVHLTTLLGAALGLGLALYAWLNRQWRALLDEVGEELRKVTWPTRDELMASTAVVLVAVALFAVYLGAFDAFFLWLTNLILNIPSEASA